MTRARTHGYVRALLVLGWLSLSGGCTYVEPLTPAGGGQPFGLGTGRAYFLKRKASGSTKVMVCDVRPAGGGVVCYESDRSPN